MPAGIDRLVSAEQYEGIKVCLLTSMRTTITANRDSGTDDSPLGSR